MLRRMIEDVTRDWVIRRRLPADFLRASIHVSPSAGLRYLYRSMDDIDSVLLGLVKEFVKPGAVVWDVGANVGLFSFAAASLGGSGRSSHCVGTRRLAGSASASQCSSSAGSLCTRTGHSGGSRIASLHSHVVSCGQVQSRQLPC